MPRDSPRRVAIPPPESETFSLILFCPLMEEDALEKTSPTVLYRPAYECTNTDTSVSRVDARVVDWDMGLECGLGIRGIWSWDAGGDAGVGCERGMRVRRHAHILAEQRRHAGISPTHRLGHLQQSPCVSSAFFKPVARNQQRG